MCIFAKKTIKPTVSPRNCQEFCSSWELRLEKTEIHSLIVFALKIRRDAEAMYKTVVWNRLESIIHGKICKANRDSCADTC